MGVSLILVSLVPFFVPFSVSLDAFSCCVLYKCLGRTAYRRLLGNTSVHVPAHPSSFPIFLLLVPRTFWRKNYSTYARTYVSTAVSYL
jgi:hypothetical protein